MLFEITIPSSDAFSSHPPPAAKFLGSTSRREYSRGVRLNSALPSHASDQCYIRRLSQGAE